MRSRFLLACCATLAVWSADARDPADESVSLSEYLEQLIKGGHQIIYSSDLVTDEMVLEPAPGSDGTPALPDVLRPFGLTTKPGPNGSTLVVAASVPLVEKAPVPAATEAPIPEIVVTSSLHRLEYAEPGAHTYIDSELSARIPVTGEEIVRLSNRLPGTASGGISSRNHVRGGEENEVLFLFDGLRLYEPYHLRDFQSITSIINSNAIGGVDFFSGAYPVEYGDRMSGVMVLERRQPARDVETELALSFFNTSVLSMGRLGDAGQGDWLFSARRGNLDLIVDVIDPESGNPDYNDFLMHTGWDFGPRARMSGNLLFSNDKIALRRPGQGEDADARYENRVGWLRWRADWSETLRSDTVMAATDISDRRQGALNVPGIVTGRLDDQSDLRVYEIRQDWDWVLNEDWMWRFGVNLKHLEAEYRHRSQRTVSAPFDSILDNSPYRLLEIDQLADGAQYALYSEFRWRPLNKLVLDFGLRWDQQTYTIGNDDRQYSPRASLLFQASARTEVRFGWGQYYQAQETNELQVSDGVGDFYPAQRAEHFVLNVNRRTGDNSSLDFSIFRKSYRSLRPRFENIFNILTIVPELQFDRVMIDPDKAESIGAEVAVSRGYGDDELIWWASYGWARTRDWTDLGKIDRSWDQTHTLKSGLSWNPGSWQVSVAAEIHTGWPRTLLFAEDAVNMAGSEAITVAVGERNSRRHAIFASLDARLSRSVDVSRGELTVYVDVTNLSDRKNACCTTFTIAEDGSLVSRTRHWLSIVPSLGLVWRF